MDEYNLVGLYCKCVKNSKIMSCYNNKQTPFCLVSIGSMSKLVVAHNRSRSNKITSI